MANTNLIELLQGQLSDGLLDQLSQQLGGANKQQTQDAASGIFSMLTSALSKNTQSTEGASALLGALDKDHDGSIMDDLAGFLGGQKQTQNQSMLNGAGILKHVLGGKQGNAIDMISKMSGLGQGQTGNLMMMLAPMVLGMLGKQKRQSNLDGGGLADLLSRSVQSSANQRQEMGLIGKFLDKDGDGSVMDDLTGMLGNLFRKR